MGYIWIISEYGVNKGRKWLQQKTPLTFAIFICIGPGINFVGNIRTC